MVYTPACTTLNQNVHMKREKEEEEEEKEKSSMIFLGTLCAQKPPLRHLDQPVREHEIM